MVAYEMSAKSLVDKYYGPGGKLRKKAAKKAREEKKMSEKISAVVAEKAPKGKTRPELLKEAKAKGIKWFNAFTKEELEKALSSKATKAEIEKLSETAKQRWLAKQK